MLAIDHVIIVVDDLDAAARRFEQRYGLASVEGGRHPGQGTGNRIVPLGDSYLELMAVVDESEAGPVGSWVRRRLTEVGDGPAALCLRTDDLDADARRTGTAPLPMTRTRPDGVELAWRLTGTEMAFAEGVPFFIQWQVDGPDHPGRAPAQHRVAATGIDWVELGGDPQRLAAWLGTHDIPLRLVEGAPGPRRVAIAVAGGGPIVIGHPAT